MANASIVNMKVVVFSEGDNPSFAPDKFMDLLIKNSYDSPGFYNKRNNIATVNGEWSYSNMIKTDDMKQVYQYVKDEGYQKMKIEYREIEKETELIRRGSILYDVNRPFVIHRYIDWGVDSFSEFTITPHPESDEAGTEYENYTNEEYNRAIEIFWVDVENELDDSLLFRFNHLKKQYGDSRSSLDAIRIDDN